LNSQNSHKIRVDIFIALIFFISISLAETLAFKDRCLWVVRYSLASKSSIDEMIEFAIEHNFNQIFVQVRGRGDCLYKSSWVPRSEILKTENFDPLDYVLKKAHKHQLKVHAWVNVYMLWSAKESPKDEQHLFNRNPEWLDAVEGESQKYILSDIRSPLDASGKEGFYLAPHHPSVNPYLLAVMKDLLNNYEVDGIHLDYVRFKNEYHGYNFGGIEKLNTTINTEKYEFPKMNPRSSSKQNLRDEFLLNSITEFVLKLKSFIKNNHKNVVLSAAVKPNLEHSSQRYFQEWDMWLSGGIIDWVLVMNYHPLFDEFVNNINLIKEYISEDEMDKIIMGVALYNQTEDVAVKKINYSYDVGFSGIALFSYNAITEQINKLSSVLSLFAK